MRGQKPRPSPKQDRTPRAGWEGAFAAADVEPNQAEREWLEAELSEDSDWTW
jgi:hypothetical protein